MSIYGYKNNSEPYVVSGSITLSETWKTYTVKSPIWQRNMVGDSLMIRFVHATDNAYFKMKDIVVGIEKIPARTILNEVVIT